MKDLLIDCKTEEVGDELRYESKLDEFLRLRGKPLAFRKDRGSCKSGLGCDGRSTSTLETYQSLERTRGFMRQKFASWRCKSPISLIYLLFGISRLVGSSVIPFCFDNVAVPELATAPKNNASKKSPSSTSQFQLRTRKFAKVLYRLPCVRAHRCVALASSRYL